MCEESWREGRSRRLDGPGSGESVKIGVRVGEREICTDIETDLSRSDRSDSPLRAHPSRPWTIQRNRLPPKKPLRPSSGLPPSLSRPSAVSRVFGFGLSIRLNAGKSAAGIAPREDGWGAGWGGRDVGGGGCVGLNKEWMRRASV